jgi:hypothetical protein
VPKQLKEARVPRKCNVVIIINNKTHHWLQDGHSTRVIGGYNSMREGV